MAHKRLSEKLDSIAHLELGMAFDEGLVWEKLESRLTSKNKSFNWNWMVAAVLFLSVLLFPLTLLEKTEPRLEISHRQHEVNPTVIENSNSNLEEVDKPAISRKTLVFSTLPTKKIEVELAPVNVAGLRASEKIELKQKNTKLQFAAEDISIIQASLEQPKIEKGRTMTIRAQWQKSTAKSNVEYQALKIKLYEKQE